MSATSTPEMFFVTQKGPLGQALPSSNSNSTDSESDSSIPALFSTFKLRDIEFPNRAFVSPMCMYSCQDGYATDFHLVHIGQFALKGYGLVMMESTAVHPHGRISPNDLGLWDDTHIAPLHRITRFVHALGGKVGIQLSHAGRKASVAPPYSTTHRGYLSKAQGGWDIVAPSPIPYAPTTHGHPLAVEDPSVFVPLFVAAAQRAFAAGFDVVEVHAAHGYLLHSFLSPITNTRTDTYGGPLLHHRATLLIAIVKAIRHALPSLVLSVRLSCTDWLAASSWNMDEARQVVAWIKPYIDLVDCSSGMLHPDQVCVEAPGFQVPFARALRTEVPTVAVGRITDPEHANRIIANGDADCVMMAREMLRDSWLYRAAKVLKTNIRVPVQYERAKEELAN